MQKTLFAIVYGERSYLGCEGLMSQRLGTSKNVKQCDGLLIQPRLTNCIYD